jgi:membrane protein implicated in regulation of membrane protease activity
MPTPRMMVALFAATGVVVAAVLALMLRSWWVLVGVLFLHVLATTAVVLYTLRRAGEGGDKPDPVTEARLEEERAEARRRRPVRRRGRDREVFE